MIAARLALLGLAGALVFVRPVTFAQDPSPDSRVLEERQRQMRIWIEESRNSAARWEAARRRAAEEDLRRLNDSLAEFATAWNAFMTEYAEKGTYNVKKAARIRKAWNRLERQQAFPK